MASEVLLGNARLIGRAASQAPLLMRPRLVQAPTVSPTSPGSDPGRTLASSPARPSPLHYRSPVFLLVRSSRRWSRPKIRQLSALALMIDERQLSLRTQSPLSSSFSYLFSTALH